jgi:hypothetical protein
VAPLKFQLDVLPAVPAEYFHIHEGVASLKFRVVRLIEDDHAVVSAFN